VKEPAREPLSLVHDFAAQQHANVFTRAFCFDTLHLPVSGESHGELANRVMLMDGIGFIFQLCEREPKVTSRAGDLEKWVANQVARKGSKQIQNTREVLSGYMGLSMVNHFGHRVTVTPHDPETFIGLIIYRVPPKSRAFRAPRFKRSRSGGFVHILRDAEYFEICDHFATPAELVDYFEFRRDLLLDWDSTIRRRPIRASSAPPTHTAGRWRASFPFCSRRWPRGSHRRIASTPIPTATRSSTSWLG
jgi:hypothetical protein